MIDGLLSALSYPQDKLKEAVAADDAAPERWYADETFAPLGPAAPFAYAAAEAGTDFVADPLNVIGAGLFTKGAQGLRRATQTAQDLGLAPRASRRGQITAGGNNYIEAGLSQVSSVHICPQQCRSCAAYLPGDESAQKTVGLG